MSYQYLDYDDSDEQNEGGRALELKFSIGYNSSMTGSVHNLTIKRNETKATKEIFYPAAHTGVIYNYETGESKLLQGHVSYKKINYPKYNYSVIQLRLVQLYTTRKTIKD
jgi:hypothetical protein